MQPRARWMMVVPILVALPLAACSQKSAGVSNEKPAYLEDIEGSGFKRVVLTSSSVLRISEGLGELTPTRFP